MAVHARELLIKTKRSGVDGLADKIISDPNSPEGLLYAKAKALYVKPLKKQYVEVCFMASSNLEEISDVLGIPQDVLLMYHDVFFDVMGLDKLSRLELLENSATDEEKVFKLWAISQGLDFVRWRLGGKVSVSPVDGLQDLFTTCIYKSKEAMFNSNVTEASKESTKYIKLAMDIAKLIKTWVMDSDGAKKDLEIALREIDPNFAGIDSLGTESLSGGGDIRSALEAAKAEAADPNAEEPDTAFGGLDDLDVGI